MGELYTGSKHPMSGADPESYFDIHMIPPGYKQKGEEDCGYLAVQQGLRRAGGVP